jgi:hypothetical protein
MIRATALLLSMVLLSSCGEDAGTDAERSELLVALQHADERRDEAWAKSRAGYDRWQAVVSLQVRGGTGDAIAARADYEEISSQAGRVESEFQELRDRFLAAGGSPELTGELEK